MAGSLVPSRHSRNKVRQTGLEILIVPQRYVSAALNAFLKIPEVSCSDTGFTTLAFGGTFDIQLTAGSSYLFGSPKFQELVSLPFRVVARNISLRS